MGTLVGQKGNVSTNVGHTVVMTNISKRYGSTQALSELDIEIEVGSVLGLVGANGAGKSTIMKILSGVTDMTTGKLVIDGEEIDSQTYNVRVARKNGIASVYQELSLSTNLTVYENFFVDYPSSNSLRWRARAKMVAQEALDAVFPNHGINVASTVDKLPLMQKQMVEIARATQNPNLKLLILDEPTSSLTSERIDQLHEYVRKATKQGVSVIYISHKLKEVAAIVDSLIVMRNGHIEWRGAANDTTEDDLVVLMGGAVHSGRAREKGNANVDASAKPLVELRNYSSKALRQIAFKAYAGEIIGVSGLEGSGQQALLQVLFNHAGKHRDAIELNCKAAYVSGNRGSEGIFSLWNIADNITISSLSKLSRGGLINRSAARNMAQEWFNRLKFKSQSTNDDITSLSGGNQQKALIARVLASDAELIILDDPTRGVDIETKQEIYSLLKSAASQGRTIVWYSTEDKEMEECDRVYIMRQGQIVNVLSGDDVTVSGVVRSAYLPAEDIGSKSAASERGFYKTYLSFLSARWVLPAITFVIVIAAIFSLNQNSMSNFGLDLLFGSAIPLVLAALSEMFVILSGDIDLGLGAFIGLVNVISATFLVKKPLLGLLIIVALVLSYGLMGAIIHIRKIPAIVVTLGASFIWTGVALTIQSSPGGSVPGWLGNFYNLKIPVIPLPIWLVIVLGVLAYWFLGKSRYGTVLRSFGNQPEVVVRAGWSSLKARVSLYLLAGLMAALAGMAVTAVSSSSDANASGGYTLLGIAAVILGGSEFIGGIVVPIGIVVGALTLSLLSSLLGFMSIGSNYQAGVEGLLLVLVLVGRVFQSKGEKNNEA
jgi:ribose transport system ATP-binding protein